MRFCECAEVNENVYLLFETGYGEPHKTLRDSGVVVSWETAELCTTTKTN